MKRVNILDRHTIISKFSRVCKVFSPILIICIVQACSFLYPIFDRFNVFTKYKLTYPLKTWNLPNNVNIDVNHDGKIDRVAWNGCITLGELDSIGIASDQYNCPKADPVKLSTFSLDNSQKNQVFLSYIGIRKNNQLEIVAMRNMKTEVYRLENNEMTKAEPDLSLRLDAILYFLSHLFVFVIGS